VRFESWRAAGLQGIDERLIGSYKLLIGYNINGALISITPERRWDDADDKEHV
jgi:hypothetical protein